MPAARARKPELVNVLTLACGHRFSFPRYRPAVQPGEEVYCWVCMKRSHSPAEASGEWRWKCRTNPRCGTRALLCGQSRELALIRGSAHTRNYPTHEVWLISPNGFVAERWYPNGDPLFGVEF